MKYHIVRVAGVMLVSVMIFCSDDRTVQAYSHLHCEGHNIHWNGHAINWRAGANSFPAGSARRGALTTANARWNEAPGDFTFGIRNWGEENLGRSNGQNEIWFSRNQDVLDGAPAICYTRWNCYWDLGGWHRNMIEADVIFDADRDWSYTTSLWSKTPYGGSRRPWGTTALHEMGHALGLKHVNSTYNIMGSDKTHIHAYSNIIDDATVRSVRHYVGEDAGSGEVHLYGMTQTVNKDDLGVTHWKYGSPSGEYSSHVPCRIYNPDDSTVSREEEVPNGFKRYLVQAGESYKVQFTFENNGYNDYEDVEVAHYLSTNSVITTADTQLRTGTMTVNRNTVYTAKHTITLPDNLVVGGTYYIGVILDYDDNISEFCETNNATWLPIRIVE
jgi:hypothetical protein